MPHIQDVKIGKDEERIHIATKNHYYKMPGNCKYKFPGNFIDRIRIPSDVSEPTIKRCAFASDDVMYVTQQFSSSFTLSVFFHHDNDLLKLVNVDGTMLSLGCHEQYITAITTSDTVHVFSLTDSDQNLEIRLPDMCLCASFHHDDFLILGSISGKIYVHHIPTNTITLVQDPNPNVQPIRSIKAIGVSGSPFVFILCGRQDGSLQVYRWIEKINQATVVFSRKPHSTPITTIVADEYKCISVCEEGNVVIGDCIGNENWYTLIQVDPLHFTSIDFSERYILIGMRNGIHVFNFDRHFIKRRKHIALLPPHDDLPPSTLF